MATTKFYHDTRSAKPGSAAPLKICICHNRRTILIPLSISVTPEQWNSEAEKIISHPNAMRLNVYIRNRIQSVDSILIGLMDSGRLGGMDAKELKKAVESGISPQEYEEKDPSVLFASRFMAFTGTKQGRTRELYMTTYRRIRDFAGESLEHLTFEDVDRHWLMAFESFLSQTCNKNARNIYLRNIRTVFNDAIDDGITSAYPFRRFKIRL